MTDPIDAFEALYEATTQGHHSVADDLHIEVSELPVENWAGYGPYIADYNSNLVHHSEEESNAQFAAVSHNIMPLLIELLKAAYNLDMCGEEERDAEAECVGEVIEAGKAALEALRKELEGE